jgi:hypothetical protein
MTDWTEVLYNLHRAGVISHPSNHPKTRSPTRNIECQENCDQIQAKSLIAELEAITNLLQSNNLAFLDEVAELFSECMFGRGVAYRKTRHIYA